ncbi:MAG: hypothetical protein VXY90_11525, partial [Pseudomonadota bacterium]|nr:hypothetical protein [Pseudomonadota bacterium]
MFRSLLSIVALGAAMTAVAAPAAAPAAAHCPETAARACAPHHHFVAVPAPVRPSPVPGHPRHLRRAPRRRVCGRVCGAVGGFGVAGWGPQLVGVHRRHGLACQPRVDRRPLRT